jgi:hypothetical protein
VGGLREFTGSLGTQLVKVFDLAVACTGLRDPEAAAAGFAPVTVGSARLELSRADMIAEQTQNLSCLGMGGDLVHRVGAEAGSVLVTESVGLLEHQGGLADRHRSVAVALRPAVSADGRAATTSTYSSSTVATMARTSIGRAWVSGGFLERQGDSALQHPEGGSTAVDSSREST